MVLIFFNIIVQEFNPKLSDFGLAKLGPSNGDTHVSTNPVGTYGYAAPEYIATGITSLPHSPSFFFFLSIKMARLDLFLN